MEDREGKNKFWKGILIGALATALFGLIAVTAAAGIWIMGRMTANQLGAASLAENENEDGGEEGTESPETLDMSRIGTKLTYMESLVNEYFLFDEEEEEEEGTGYSAEDWIYAGYMFSLNDPYSSYYNAEEFASLSEETEGEYCGIGVQVSQNVYTGLITVVKVFKDSPAEEAGMLPGDYLYKVEDLEATGEDLSILVSDHIKGEEGTTVHLTVYRESTGEYVEMDVERRMVENPTVEYEMLEQKLGYIALSSFEEVSSEQFITAVDDLEAQGMEGLIIDLRNNGGGVTQAAEDIADYILPEGDTLVSFKGKGVPETIYYSDDGHSVDVPVAVLVNGQSASSSEVLTGALKDNDAAVVVGELTFGKGIAQGIFPLPDGSALKLTTSYYYTPSGECIHEIGIEPDVEVKLKEELLSMVEIPKEEDNQLQAAIDVLLEGEEAVKERLAAEAAENPETDPMEEAFSFPPEDGVGEEVTE